MDTAVFMGPGFRRDDALGAKAWAKALARLKHAEAQIAALAHSEDEDAYDHAVDRQIAALSRVLTARAPDLSAVAWKIGLIARHAAWELDCGAAALAVLQDDVLRIAA
ncbi:MAG TPA: hypothetical protein VEZ70_07125 [Allosphingosinicella sp.]|nr:hypothetical protein [Allosphingosinicella sp.]